MNVTEKLVEKHNHSSYENRLYQRYLANPDDLSSEEYIELGKRYRDIDENRFQVWTYEVSDDNTKHYRYNILSSYRKFLDNFNRIVGNEGISVKQIRRIVSRYKNRALIVRNLYEKVQKKQIYSTISERMWDVVLGVGRNTQFINALIDCGAVVRVYNASGTRKIGSIYSLNPVILEDIYNAFDIIPDFWKQCQIDCEIDDETFEELSNGQYSDTISVFQDNAEDKEETHNNFVSFCSNKYTKPKYEVLSKIMNRIDNVPYSSGWNIKLSDLDEVAQVYGFLYDWVTEKTDLVEIRKVANSVYTNAHNYIKYKPSIHISNKKFDGIGIRAVTELCSKPKFDTVCKNIDKLDIPDRLVDDYKNEAWKKSRESILSEYGELDHFDVSSSIPHVMMLMNDGKYRINDDLYYVLCGKPEGWNDEVRTMIKQCYMQAHFSDESVAKIFNNIKYNCANNSKYDAMCWYDANADFVKTFIANVKNETVNGKSTMDFYHESNIFILLRKYWTEKGIKVIGQVYDSFWFNKGVMSEEQFKKDLKMVAEKYAKNFGKVPFENILDF